MNKLIVLFTIASLASLAACGNKEDENAAPATAGKPAPASRETPDGTAPAVVTAPDFFASYSSLKGMKALDAYPNGVVVSGTVLRTIEEMDGSPAVWLDAGDGAWISLGFADKGTAAKAKGVKQGDAVAAKCSIGGMTDRYILNIDCQLR